MYVNRLMKPTLNELASSRVGRGLILTGARQTGKTTLLKREFVPPYEYHSFDEMLSREGLARRPSGDWLARGRSYVFDEIQKAPSFFDTVKVILDEGPVEQRIILSGSAQIRLLSGVRETLAGRVVTRELFSLTAAELADVSSPALCELVSCSSSGQVRELLDEIAFSAAQRKVELARARQSFAAICEVGGMPLIHTLDQPEHRWIWLEEYCQTYLQRDIADLGRVADLDDFIRLERLAARRTACTLNYADLARDADLSPVTAKKYLRYLELSYQSFRLEAYRSPREKRLIKAPRLHWLDLGIQRVLAGSRSGLTGEQLETAVVGEVYKLARALRLDVELSYLRTKDQREVDLIIRVAGGGYVAFEVKAGDRASGKDARHLRGLDSILDGPLLAGLVVHTGVDLQVLGDRVLGVPVSWLFAAAP